MLILTTLTVNVSKINMQQETISFVNSLTKPSIEIKKKKKSV